MIKVCSFVVSIVVISQIECSPLILWRSNSVMLTSTEIADPEAHIITLGKDFSSIRIL